MGKTILPDASVVSRRRVFTARVCPYARPLSSLDFSAEGARKRRAVGERWVFVPGEKRTWLERRDMAARFFRSQDSKPGGFREACALHPSQSGETPALRTTGGLQILIGVSGLEVGPHPSVAKATFSQSSPSARLKPCPFKTNPRTFGLKPIPIKSASNILKQETFKNPCHAETTFRKSW